MRAGRRTVCFAFALGAFALCAAPAVAHAVLEASVPAAGVQIARSPAEITLTFDEPVETSLGSLRLLDAAGRQRASGPVVHPGGDATRVAIRVGPLERGRYVVAWRVVSSDSHIVNGAYAFGIGVPAGDAPPFAADPGGAVLASVVHFVLLAAALLAIGLPLGALAFARGGAPAEFAEFAAWFVVAASAFADVALRADLGGGSLADSFETHAGALRSLTMLAALFGGLSLIGRGRNWFGLAPSCALLVLSLSAAGHAADGGWPVFGVAADALHLTAAAAWIGVIAVGTMLGPTALLAKISPVATLAVATIVLTGIVQSVRDVGAWRPLLTTAYGRAIDAKIALLFAALAIAWSARRSFARGSFDIRRRLVAEFAVVATVIVVTAILVDLPLPRDEAAAAIRPATAAFRVRGIDVAVSALRRDPRHWALHVDGRTASGAPAAIDEVDASISESQRHTGPIAVPLTRSSDGAYDGTVSLPFAGAWSASVSARSGDFDEGHTTLSLTDGTQ
jgi:copper transport protein